MRRLLALMFVSVAAMLAITGPAYGSRNARWGIQDDAWLLYAGDALPQRLATLDRLGVRTVRFTLHWDMVAPTKPATPANPKDPAYRWAPFDAVLDGLRAHGIAAIVTLWGAPRWSNGGHGPNWLPSSGFGLFATAAARRYPWVHLWTIWNEPNTRIFSVPVSPRAYVMHVLNPGYAALHAVSRANVVAGGVTSPRKTVSGMAPLAFMARMHAAHARLDAYAQNPYPGMSSETPFKDPCSWCHTFTMAHLALIRREVTRYFGSKPLWLTEYGYQTNPPDRFAGVPLAAQASYVGQAALRVWEQPGVTVLIHFLVRDEPSLGGWQSGLLTVRGARKPSYSAFALPLAEQSRSGSRVVVWGQVRPGTGARRYTLQRWSGRRWVNVGGSKLTGRAGTFRTAISARPGIRVRIRTPWSALVSPPLVLS